MELQNQQQNSITSFKPSTRLKEILTLTRTDAERKLVELSFEKQVGQLKGSETNSIIDLVGFWAATLGVTKDITSVDLKMVSTFIFNQFGNLTLSEIKYGIQLSVAHKLNCDPQLYGRGLSVAYVGNILSAYIEHKRSELKDLMYRLQNQNKEKIVTPEEKMNIAKETLVMLYREWEQTKLINDPLSTIYNMLRRVKLLVPTKEEIDDAIAHGKEATIEYLKNQKPNYAVKSQIIKEDEGILNKRFARNYIVQKYFENNALNLILEKLIIEHFQNNGDNG